MTTSFATSCFRGCHPHLRRPCKLNKPYVVGSRVPLRLEQHAQHLPAVINTEVSTADSWAMDARAAMLSLKVEELEECIQRDSQNAWVAICEPEREHQLPVYGDPNVCAVPQHALLSDNMQSKICQPDMRSIAASRHSTPGVPNPCGIATCEAS